MERSRKLTARALHLDRVSFDSDGDATGNYHGMFSDA